MTPAAIMAAFEARGPLPRAALRAAGASRDAMVPVFLDYIDRLQSAEIADLDHMDAWIFIAFLLAEWQEPRGFPPLARLLRRDPEFVDALMGDAITEALARVMAGVFDGDPQPLFDIILDPAADGFVRGAMFDTLALVALKDPALQARVTAFLTGFQDRAGDETGEEVWWAWAEAIAALGLSAMAARVQTVFDQGLISPQHSEYRHFSERLQATLETGRADWFKDDTNHRPIVDTIAELARWHCFSAAYLAESSRVKPSGWSFPPSNQDGPAPVVLPPKVGRNDPCPCGSGKKYKKCCLG